MARVRPARRTGAAWAYRYRPAIGVTLKRRQAGQPPETLARSWEAQLRLHAK